MNITTEDIKNLREATGVSVMQCKKALEEAEGDFERAKAVLREQSAKAAEKKGDRVLGAGTIGSYIHANKSVGAMVTLCSETDFVSKNGEFEALAKDIAMHIVATNSENIESLLAEPFIKNPEITIQDLVQQAVQKFGEKVEIVKFSRLGVLEA
jgi:elongation factor Ts